MLRSQQKCLLWGNLRHYMHNVGVAGKTLTKTGHIEAIREKKTYIH